MKTAGKTNVVDLTEVRLAHYAAAIREWGNLDILAYAQPMYPQPKADDDHHRPAIDACRNGS